MRLLLTWILNALALLALPWFFRSIHVDGFTTALVAALVLGLVNTLIRQMQSNGTLQQLDTKYLVPELGQDPATVPYLQP